MKIQAITKNIEKILALSREGTLQYNEQTKGDYRASGIFFHLECDEEKDRLISTKNRIENVIGRK